MRNPHLQKQIQVRRDMVVWLAASNGTARCPTQIAQSVADVWTWVAIDADTKLHPAFFSWGTEDGAGHGLAYS